MEPNWVTACVGPGVSPRGSLGRLAVSETLQSQGAFSPERVRTGSFSPSHSGYPTCHLEVISLPSKMLSSSVRGERGTAGRVEREEGELADPQCPKLSPHFLSRISSPPPSPSQPRSPRSAHLLPSSLLRRRSRRSGHSRPVPGLGKDPLTWL